ncbi:MAG: protein kinase [Anaerolineae bacterium]
MMEHIQRNPFICGGPVPSSHFVGREREVKTIFDAIANPAPGSVAISGDPRMGKTSLLQYICDPTIIERWSLSEDKYVLLFLDCGSTGDFTPPNFWQRVLVHLLRKTKDRTLAEMIQSILTKQEVHYDDFEAVLYEMHTMGQVLVLLLDEFEWVIDIGNERSTRTFLGRLRALINRQPKVLSLIIATSQDLTGVCRPLRFSTSPFYNSFIFQRLKPFTEANINQLIDKALKQTGVEFSPEDCAYVSRIGGLHPYLVQRAASLIFDAKTQGLEVADCLEVIGADFEEQARLHFAELWRDLGQPEKRLLIILTMRSIAQKKNEWIRNNDIEILHRLLSRYESALKALADRGLITEVCEAAILCPPAFESWILKEIRSCDEEEFSKYESLASRDLAIEQAQCVSKIMRLVSGRELGSPDPVRREKIGRYEIIEELGRGGTSVIYKAHDPNIDRPVALKVLYFGSSAQSRESKKRFRREAMSAGRLKHPNIVAIHDADEDRGEPFIVMEYLEGPTLAQVIETESHLAWKRVVNIISQISDGLDYAHQHGVVHRDIKPSNIFLLENDHVKVADFGLAKLASASDPTPEGKIYGTFGYASPEQLRGEEIDGRTDIFSLGIAICEMLTGEKPFEFEKEDVHIMVSQTLDEKPLTFTALDSELLPGVKEVLLKATAKDANQRYQTCAELAQDLRKCLTLKEGRAIMGLPADQQFALAVLAQATQFLFDELGRRLDFWRKKKGEQATPESVEPVSQPDGVVVKLDDLERQVDMQRLLSKKENIETSMNVIRKEKRRVNALREQLADPLTQPITRADIEAGIKELEEEIEEESGKLEALLKEVYGEGPE